MRESRALSEPYGRDVRRAQAPNSEAHSLGRQRFLARTIGAVAGIASACGLRHSPASAQSGGLQPIRVGLSPSDDDTAALLYAKGSGMFEKVGLDVQTVRLTSGSAIAAAVAGGGLDVGKSSLISLINAHARGIPFGIIATCALYSSKAPFDGILVPKDSPVQSGRDLNGKTVSTQSINDIGQIGMSAWVDAHGGDSKTLHVIEIPTSGSAAALETHRVDAAICLEPVLTATLDTGKFRAIGSPFSAIAPSFLFAGYFTTLEYTNKNLDAVKRFASVMNQAGAFVNAHHKEAAPIVAAQIKVPVEEIEKAQWSVAGTSIDAAGIKPLIDAATKYGTIPRSFPPQELIHPAFLPRDTTH